MQPGRKSLQKLLGQKNPLSHRSGVEKPGILRLLREVQKEGILRLLWGVQKPGILRLLWGVEKPGILRLLSGVEKPGILRLLWGVEKPGILRLLRGVEKPGILRLLWGVEKPGILRLLRGVEKPGILRLLRGRPSRNRSSTRSTKGLAVFGVFWFYRHRDIFHNMSCSFTSFHLLSLQFSMSCTYTNKLLRSCGRLSILYVVVWVSSFLSTPSC